MARKALQKDILVKLIVGAGQASPSPPVGSVLGSKGVKSMDFCKEFNARTTHYTPGTPIPAVVTVRPDRSFTFELRTPPTASMLMKAADVPILKNRVRGAGNVAGPKHMGESGVTGKASKKEQTGNGGLATIGKPISLKHVYEIAKIKASEPRMKGLELKGIVKSVISQAASIGVQIIP